MFYYVILSFSNNILEWKLADFLIYFFRVRPTSSVSKSVSVLDLSGKDKSAKPPRRLSIPAKSIVSPAPKLSGNITPISEARQRRSVASQGKNDTPVSDVSKTTSRKKFNVLSSASYWLSQIKLSESAAKHSISLGFFKLAVEAGCEVLLQFMYFSNSSLILLTSAIAQSNAGFSRLLAETSYKN